jgi:branched-chain amino acid transport system substrate-binding protein
MGHVNRRRTLPALLVLTGLLVAACGDDDEDGGDSTDASDTPAATEAPTEATEPAATEPAATDAPGTTGAASGDPIVIGFPTAATEFLSFYDGPIFEAAQIAADEVNAAGGVLGRPLELRQVDNQSDIANVEPATLELLDGGAEIIVTSCDFDFGSPAARAATERGVFALGCASAPEFGYEGLGELVFNTFGADITESSVMAQFTIDQGWEQIFMFQDQSLEATITVCETYEEALNELGGEVVGTATFEGADFSLAPQLAELRDSGADAIVLCTVPPGGGAAVKQIRDESDLPIVSQVAMEGEFWLDCCPGLSDFYAVGLGSTRGDDPDPVRAAFFEEYAERAGKPMDVSIGMAGYATIQALAIAIEQAGSTDGAAVAEAMGSFTDVPLATGPTTYTPACHIALGRGMVIMQVQDGELQYKADVTPSFVPESIC